MLTADDGALTNNFIKKTIVLINESGTWRLR